MEDEILDTGAVAMTDSAEDQGNREAIEAELESQAAEFEDSEEEEVEEGKELPESQEGDKPTEENKDKGAHQKTLEERAAELTEKAIAKFREEQAEITRLAAERLEAEKKPFVELTQDQLTQLNTEYSNAIAAIADLQESIRLGDHSTETILSLRQAQKWVHDTEAWYADNEAKKAEWSKKQDEQQRNAADYAEKTKRLETTAEVYREANNIPQEVWDAGNKWFYEQISKDKILGLKFADAYRLQGDVGAVEFAHKYVMENMGKNEQSEIEKKQEAKKTLPPGGGGGATTASETVMAQLRALHKKATDSGDEADFAAFTAAKRKAGITGSIFSKAARK